MFWRWKKRAYAQLDRCIELEKQNKLLNQTVNEIVEDNKILSKKLKDIVEISNINQDAKAILDYKMELEIDNKKPSRVMMSKDVHTRLLLSFGILSTTMLYDFTTNGIGRIFGLNVFLSQEHRLKVE